MLAHQLEFAAQMSGHLETNNGKVTKKTFTLIVDTDEQLHKTMDGFAEFTIDGIQVESEWKAELVKFNPASSEATYRFSIV